MKNKLGRVTENVLAFIVLGVMLPFIILIGLFTGGKEPTYPDDN